MSEIPVKGKDGFYRNSQTNAIVNKNRLEYETYVSSREKMNSEKERIVNLEHEMNGIKQDLQEIKELLLRNIQK